MFSSILNRKIQIIEALAVPYPVFLTSMQPFGTTSLVLPAISRRGPLGHENAAAVPVPRPLRTALPCAAVCGYWWRRHVAEMGLPGVEQDGLFLIETSITKTLG